MNCEHLSPAAGVYYCALVIEDPVRKSRLVSGNALTRIVGPFIDIPSARAYGIQNEHTFGPDTQWYVAPLTLTPEFETVPA